MSLEMISKHLGQHKATTPGCAKEEQDNSEVDLKAKQVEDAARYFKTRLRIMELCSDNSWGKARSSIKS